MTLLIWLSAVQVLLSVILLIGLKKLGTEIMAKLTEEFNQIKADILEGTTELSDRIKTLEDALAIGSLTAEQSAALDEVKAAAAALAAIVPNPVPAPTATTTPIEPPVTPA